MCFFVQHEFGQIETPLFSNGKSEGTRQLSPCTTRWASGPDCHSQPWRGSKGLLLPIPGGTKRHHQHKEAPDFDPVDRRCGQNIHWSLIPWLVRETFRKNPGEGGQKEAHLFKGFVFSFCSPPDRKGLLDFIVGIRGLPVDPAEYPTRAARPAEYPAEYRRVARQWIPPSIPPE